MRRLRRPPDTSASLVLARAGAEPIAWRICILALALLFFADAGLAQVVDPNLWVTNGTVLAAGRSGNTLYIGGAFSRVSPATGSGVPIDTTGSGTLAAGFPKVAGTVHVAVPDGVGGWYIGGTFSSVGGLARQSLARIRPNMTVAPWNPGVATTFVVRALAVSGGTIYVGGQFTSVGGQSRNNLAALDTNGVATAWNPDASQTVHSIATSGPTVYVGGSFNMIGATARTRIAAINAGSGAPTAWNPGASGIPYVLVPGDSTIFVGGQFINIGGQARNNLAELGMSTGTPTPWNPNVNGTVLALVVTGTHVFAAGGFSVVNGATPRSRLAKLSRSGTGMADLWNPGANATVYALALSGPRLYVAGDFTTLGGQSYNHLGVVSEAGIGGLGGWNPGANGTVQSLALAGATMYAGGSFTGMGGVTRNNIAALDTQTGMPTSWNPNASSTVAALALSGSTVYAGGVFTSIGGQPRNRIAALDASSGLATSWNPNASQDVHALAVGPTTVYAGGAFIQMGAQSRPYLAAIDKATGALTAWDPNANGVVSALALNGPLLYAGGTFSSMGGQTRNNIAALNTAINTNQATSWNPGANGQVRAIALGGAALYAGGAFTSIGAGAARNNIAALDTATGVATSWNPNPNGSAVYCLAPAGPTVYAGGFFSSIGGQLRNYVAALDAASGVARPWNPNPDNSVAVVVAGDSTVYAGGAFSYMDDLSQSGISAITAAPALTAIVPASGGNTGPATVTISGGGLLGPIDVKLVRAAHPEIPGTDVLVATDGRSLTATFNLAGADTGLWSVEVKDATLTNAFRITALDAPQLNVSIVGPSLVLGVPTIRKNRRTAFDLVIENHGNVDARSVPLWLAGIPTDATLELDFALAYPPQSGGEPNWTTVPLYFESAAGRYLTLVIPRVPPGATTRRVWLTVPDTHPTITLTAALTPPWEDGAVFQSCLLGGGISNPACMGSQLTSFNAFLAANPQLPAVSGIALWAKVAWNCEPGIGTLGAALGKAEQVLDYLGVPAETGNAPTDCGNVLRPRWRQAQTVAIGGAVDPNDKLGAQGTQSGLQAFPYSIRFENLSSATLPAQTVIVEDVLDHTKLDLATLSLDAVRFGSLVLSPPPGQTSWSTRVDLRPAKNIFVDIVASLDPFTHRLTWHFNSVDATTGGPPPINVGFLPPNDVPPEGEGSVLFTVRPLSGLTNGASISNAASITFDDPPAINTPPWQNTLDNVAPQSRVKPFTTVQDPARYTVQWEPIGAQPDLRDYTIYAREDGGPYWAWRINTTALSDTFHARVGHSYSFYSRSRDQVGNVEPAPTVADAQYTSTVGVGERAAPELGLAGAWPNPARGPMRVTFSLPSDAPASLELFDVAGRRVLKRAVGMLGPGEHVVTLGGERELRAGLYFLRLSQGTRELHARVALMR